MYRYEYILKYGTQIHKCQHPVVGFEEEGVKFGKASDDKGVIKSYSDEFELIGNDALFVKNIVIINGYNEIIKFEVYKNDSIKGSSLEYSAQMDLSTIEYGNNRIKFMVKDGGYITYFDNIKNTDRLIKGNTKEITYTGNQYNFDAYLKASTEFEMYYSPNIKNILEINLLENNDNLEDIRMFTNGGNRQLNVSELDKLTNDDCFFISNTQEYLKTIKTNLNINTFTQDNHRVPFGSAPVAAKIKYKYEVLAYSNLLDEWLITDTSLIFKNDFYVTQNYRLISRATGQVSDGYIYCNTIGNANNIQINYQNNSSIGLVLNNINKNYKIIINVSMVQMEYIDSNGYRFDPLSDFGAGANFKYNCTPNVELKMTFENFYLVKLRHLYCFPLVDVYKRLIADESRSDRPQYNINYDLSKLESSNLYLTSAGMLCSNDELKTTLDKLLRFIYLATGLRQIVDFKDNVYNVRFEKYEDSFKDVEIAKITVEGDVFLNVETEKIYTDVEVGWNNKDSGIFKSLEYNTINKFRTQYYNMESKTLSLTCDYSASITDIETIVYNAGYNDKTNNVDEIYVFSTYNDNGTLRNIRQSGTLPMVMCSNVSLTPKRLLEVHKYELSDLLYHKNVLQYSSTNGKADITFTGIKENDNVTFTDQIMQPFILSFDGVINQSVIKVDANKYGYFTFLYNGQFIRGYIAEGSDSVTVASNGNVSKLRLIVKKNVTL